jgi:hypothetical protein
MSKENVDPESRAIFNRLHPDIHWTNVIGEIREGKLACARGVDDLLQASQEYSLVDEVTDLGDDRVLLVLRSSMRGQSSGAARDCSSPSSSSETA